MGIASNKFLAKVASDLEKPDGFVIIPDEGCQEILDPLPVSRIWGIGKVTQKALKSTLIISPYTGHKNLVSILLRSTHLAVA